MKEVIFYTVVDIIITSIEVFCLSYLFRNLPKKSDVLWHRGLWYGAMVVLVVTLTYIQSPILLKTVCLGIIVLLFANKIYKIKVSKAFLYYILFTVILMISETIVVQLWEIFDSHSIKLVYQGMKFVALRVSFVVKILQFLFTVITERYFLIKNRDFEVKDMSAFLVYTVTTVGVMFCLNKGMIYLEDENYAIICVIGSLLLMISFIYQTVWTNKYLETKRREQLEESSLRELQIKNEYYQKKLEDEEQVRKIYHDLNNHLLILEEDVKNDYKKEMLQELQEKIAGYGEYIKSGNEFLDIIIKEKIKIARENEIEVILNIKCSSFGSIKPIDISTIFGNLFDNAIEACQKTDRTEKRIKVNCRTQRGLLSIVFKNTIANDGNRINILKSSKGDERAHGMGINNVRNAIERYNGECNINIYENEFVFSIIIPFNDIYL